VAERINLEAPGMTRPVDTLSGLAPLLRVRPELQQLCRFGAQWSSDHSSEAEGWAPFHFVTQGTCIIELSGRSIPLSAGDVAVLPRGRRHSVRGPTTPAGARGPFGIRSSFLGAVDLDSVEGMLHCLAPRPHGVGIGIEPFLAKNQGQGLWAYSKLNHACSGNR
jgi:hypothetical protein